MAIMLKKSESEVRKSKDPIWIQGSGGAIAALLLSSALLVGCATHSKQNFTVGSVQHTYKTKHPIIIDEKEKVLDIPVASSSYDLPIPSAGAIEGFANAFNQSANGVLTVMIPSGSPNESAVRRLLPKIVRTLERAGVSERRIRTVSYYGAEHGASAPVRLSYSAISANVERCGRWPEDLAESNSENQNYHNFGCASQNNLAAMIANPADLLAPRGMSPIDSERRNRAIDAYREGTVGENASPQVTQF